MLGNRYTYTSFGVAFVSLCDELASVAHCLSTPEVDSVILTLFVACQFIPLDKCPSIIPISIGDVPHQIEQGIKIL